MSLAYRARHPNAHINVVVVVVEYSLFSPSLHLSASLQAVHDIAYFVSHTCAAQMKMASEGEVRKRIHEDGAYVSSQCRFTWVRVRVFLHPIYFTLTYPSPLPTLTLDIGVRPHCALGTVPLSHSRAPLNDSRERELIDVAEGTCLRQQ